MIGAGARRSVVRRSVESRPRCCAVRRMVARICWVSAPRRDRLPPPQTFRVITAGRRACSARQFVASRSGSTRKLKSAGSSTVRCRAARLAPRAARPPRRCAFRERRRLARPGATRGLQFVFQPRVLTLQARPLPFDARAFRFLSFEFPTQPRILSPQFVDWIGGRPLGAPAHTPLMPESPPKYKSDAVTNYEPDSPRHEGAHHAPCEGVEGPRAARLLRRRAAICHASHLRRTAAIVRRVLSCWRRSIFPTQPQPRDGCERPEHGEAADRAE
jgi:hypothetical protein